MLKKVLKEKSTFLSAQKVLKKVLLTKSARKSSQKNARNTPFAQRSAQKIELLKKVTENMWSTQKSRGKKVTLPKNGLYKVNCPKKYFFFNFLK